MNNVQDIEAAFNSQEWDQQMELDLGAGRLDWLANEAMADLDDELIWVWIGTHAQYDQLLIKNGAGGTRTHGLRFRKPFFGVVVDCKTLAITRFFPSVAGGFWLE